MTFDLDRKKVMLGLSNDRLNRSDSYVTSTIINEKTKVIYNRVG